MRGPRRARIALIVEESGHVEAFVRRRLLRGGIHMCWVLAHLIAGHAARNPGNTLQAIYHVKVEAPVELQPVGRWLEKLVTNLHTSAYVSIRQHTSAYVSIREKLVTNRPVHHIKDLLLLPHNRPDPHLVDGTLHTSAYVSIRSIRQHTMHTSSMAPCTRQHSSAYVGIRQHTSAHLVDGTLKLPTCQYLYFFY